MVNVYVGHEWTVQIYVTTVVSQIPAAVYNRPISGTETSRVLPALYRKEAALLACCPAAVLALDGSAVWNRINTLRDHFCEYNALSRFAWKILHFAFNLLHC